jgi:hypothetical protein
MLNDRSAARTRYSAVFSLLAVPLLLVPGILNRARCRLDISRSLGGLLRTLYPLRRRTAARQLETGISLYAF